MIITQRKEFQWIKKVNRHMKLPRKLVLMFINKLTIKEKNSAFIVPLENCMEDNYDLINFTANTTLSLLNYWMHNPTQKKYKIYLVVYHPDRIRLYKELVASCDHLSFTFVLSPLCFKGIKIIIGYLNYLMVKFKCKYWFEEGLPDIRTYAVKGQHQFVLGYFASCKSNYIFNTALSADIRRFSMPEKVTIFSTSFFDSMAKSAAFGVPIQCFFTYGLARNDNFRNNIYSQNAKSWIDSKKKTNNTRVVLYAPTFRDYESKEDVHERSIWGVGYDDTEIKRFLSEKDIIVIAKLHSWQNESAIAANNESIILYEPNFDFSFYDLMKVADILITDYSSIGYDWLFIDKPIIYNLWDLEKYRKERGLAYEPYERVCSGEIVKDTNELINAIDTALSRDLYADKRRKIKDLMFSVQDYSSSPKIIEYITK